MQNPYASNWTFTFCAALMFAAITTIASQAADNAVKAGSVSDADQQFMNTAAAGGLGEVELGRLAADKATDPEVKKHAQHMVDDHTRANKELEAIAATKGVTLPTEPDAQSKALLEKLRGISGENFDRTYIDEAGVKAHSEMKTAFEKQKDTGADDDVRKFAARTLPVVEEHLKQSEKLQASLRGATK